jgi:hypothetical protein
MVALGLVGLTGWVLTRSDAAVPTDGPALAFVCEKCGKPFELTAREVDAALRSGAGGDPRLGKAGGFPCKLCGEAAGVRDEPGAES